MERLEPHNLTNAIEIARAAYDISGYGPVKDASMVRYESRLKVLLEDFEKQGERPTPAVSDTVNPTYSTSKHLEAD